MLLVTLVETFRWTSHNLFWDNLGGILKDFKLGSEWRLSMFMYVVTGEIGCVPPHDKGYDDFNKALAQLEREGHRIGVEVMFRSLIPLRQKKEIIPLRLPPNTKWEDITIKLLDGEIAKITAPGFSTNVNYKEMGFQDDRTQKQNMQWKLLECLAENHGQLSWKDQQAADTVKKKKQLLSDTLKAYFQIDEDPFFPYAYMKAYTIKIKLIPD